MKAIKSTDPKYQAKYKNRLCKNWLIKGSCKYRLKVNIHLILNLFINSANLHTENLKLRLKYH